MCYFSWLFYVELAIIDVYGKNEKIIDNFGISTSTSKDEQIIISLLSLEDCHFMIVLPIDFFVPPSCFLFIHKSPWYVRDHLFRVINASTNQIKLLVHTNSMVLSVFYHRPCELNQLPVVLWDVIRPQISIKASVS